jgi:hypothetical protein
VFAYDEFELTESAYRHGHNDEDVAELLRGTHFVITSRRGRRVGYEIFGRNRAGDYLLVAGRVPRSGGRRILVVFHINRMTRAARRRLERQVQ